MNRSPEIPIEAKLDVIVESILFLVRHSVTPDMADALIADLHRAVAHDPIRSRYVDDLAYRLRERDEFVPENDA